MTMTAKDNIFIENFYLWKEDKNEVFIPWEYAQFLTPQQREGIRFLYAQYTKGRKGVILNGPVVHMDMVQAVLFSWTVKGLPPLLLCQKSDIEIWVQLFRFWTGFDLNIGFPPSGVKYKLTLAHVSPLENADLYCKVQWGVVIVNHENALSHLRCLRRLDCQFKIWITDQDVKRLFGEFAEMCTWISPRDAYFINTFKLQDIQSKMRSLKQKITLDALLDDVLLRRNCERLPDPYKDEFTKKLPYIDAEEYFKAFRLGLDTRTYVNRLIIYPNKTNKNKDPTGQKVKHTKVNNRETITAEIHAKEPVAPEVIYVTRKKANESKKECRLTPDTQNMSIYMYDDVESFIKNNPPLQFEDIKMQTSDIDSYSESEHDCEEELEEDIVSSFSSSLSDQCHVENMKLKTVKTYQKKKTTIKKLGTVDEIATANTRDAVDEDKNFFEIKDEFTGIIQDDTISRCDGEKRKSLDTSLKELQEAAVKKYKGSVLDSLF